MSKSLVRDSRGTALARRRAPRGTGDRFLFHLQRFTVATVYRIRVRGTSPPGAGLQRYANPAMIQNDTGHSAAQEARWGWRLASAGVERGGRCRLCSLTSQETRRSTVRWWLVVASAPARSHLPPRPGAPRAAPPVLYEERFSRATRFPKARANERGSHPPYAGDRPSQLIASVPWGTQAQRSECAHPARRSAARGGQTLIALSCAYPPRARKSTISYREVVIACGKK